MRVIVNLLQKITMILTIHKKGGCFNCYGMVDSTAKVLEGSLEHSFIVIGTVSRSNMAGSDRADFSGVVSATATQQLNFSAVTCFAREGTQ